MGEGGTVLSCNKQPSSPRKKERTVRVPTNLHGVKALQSQASLRAVMSYKRHQSPLRKREWNVRFPSNLHGVAKIAWRGQHLVELQLEHQRHTVWWAARHGKNTVNDHLAQSCFYHEEGFSVTYLSLYLSWLERGTYKKISYPEVPSSIPAENWELKSIWIWDNRPSSKVFKLLFLVIKALKIKANNATTLSRRFQLFK